LPFFLVLALSCTSAPESTGSFGSVDASEPPFESILVLSSSLSEHTSSLFKGSIPSIELVTIPAGEFIMGPGPMSTVNGIVDNPAHPVVLDSYAIGRYPVTNAQYSLFLEDTGYREPVVWDETVLDEMSDHPVAGITYIDAWLFTRWLSRRTGRNIHLPTEAQWEKAASWNPEIEAKLSYPWGFEEDNPPANTGASSFGSTSPVGSFSPDGDSPYGVADMIGNVEEWNNSLYAPYPYDPDDGREFPGLRGRHAQRGGDWYTSLNTASRRNLPSDWWVHLWGFRVAESDALETGNSNFLSIFEQYWNEVMADWNRQVSSAPDNPNLYYGIGTSKYNYFNSGVLNELESAVLDFQTSIRLSAENPLLSDHPLAWDYYNLALVQSALGDYEEAFRSISTSIELADDDPDAYVIRAKLMAIAGEPENAAADLAKANRLAGQIPLYLNNLIETYIAFADGEYETVISLVDNFHDSLLYDLPQLTELFFLRALSYDAIGNFDKAFSDLYLYWELTPYSPYRNDIEQILRNAGLPL
jgi:formylglycine-generating enzyme required for sulfatase activity